MDLAEANSHKLISGEGGGRRRNDLASLKTAICWKPLTIKILYIIKVTKLSFEQSAGTKNR